MIPKTKTRSIRLQRDVTGLACGPKSACARARLLGTKAEALIGRASDAVSARGYCRLAAVSSPAMSVVDRVQERRRAAALARHYRDNEALSAAEMARRLGRAPAMVKAYLYDPTGAKAREVKARYRGVRRGCGAPTGARNGKGDAYAYCPDIIPDRQRCGRKRQP